MEVVEVTVEEVETIGCTVVLILGRISNLNIYDSISLRACVLDINLLLLNFS